MYVFFSVMSQSVSWADLTEDPPHASGEELSFSGFLIPPSPAWPPLAFSSVSGLQGVGNITIKNQASSAKYDLKVYTPYTSNNI